MVMVRELLFYGDDVIVYNFPEDVDIIYPNSPIHSPKNAVQIIEKAVNQPIGMDTLEEILNRNSKVVIAFDDVSIPLPLPINDPRRVMALTVLKHLKNIGIPRNNILFVCATGLHRKCTKSELKGLIGEEIISNYKVICHDAEDKILSLGETESGYPVEINRHAAEADLLLYLSVVFIPMNGGWKSIVVGLGTYKSIREHHIPQVLSKGSYMDIQKSYMHKIIWEMGRYIENFGIKVFHIETVINNDFYSGFFQYLWKKLRGENVTLTRKILLRLVNSFPQSVKSLVRKRYRSSYEVIFSLAGHPEKIHPITLDMVKRQNNVVANKRYDVLIYGLPNLTPYSVNSDMNPILFHTVVNGYLYNMYNNKPLLKDKGIIIVQNPLYETFDVKQHAAYKYLYDNYFLKGRISYEELSHAETELINNDKLMKEYREGIAYHPVHCVIAYYWGTLGIENVGKIIVSGAVDRRPAEALGYLTTQNLDEAINLAKEYLGNNISIAYLALPPIFIADVK